jgi:adenylate cyclase class 2
MENEEIEVRFLNINKDNLITQLKSLGADDKGESVLSEVIFYDPGLTWLEERRFVRLRSKNNEVTLTYKQNKDQKIDSAYEVEFDVSDKTEAKKFLECIGLVSYREQEKKRHTLTYNKIIIDIDTWPSLPPYVEFEGPSEEALKEFTGKLNLSWSDAIFEDAKMILEKKYNIPIGTMKYFTFSKIQ